MVVVKINHVDSIQVIRFFTLKNPHEPISERFRTLRTGGVPGIKIQGNSVVCISKLLVHV